MENMQNDPIVGLFDLEKAKDHQAYNANIDFDKRISRTALPIKRMITPDGKLNKAAIANMTPFDDPYQMWEDMNANMPKGRGIDQAVFQEKYQTGKAMFDMSAANQLNLLRQAGWSEKKINKAFAGNNEMKRYLIENGLLQPVGTKSSSVMKEILKQTALAGGSYGGIRAAQLYGTTPKVDSAQLKSLRSGGYDFKDGKLKRMSASEIIKHNAENWDDPADTRPKTKAGKPDGRYKWGTTQKAQTPEWKAEAKKVIDARRERGVSRTA
jgi:hypothetical protein